MKTTPIDNLQAPPAEARTLRADARRNVELLIVAARAAFAAEGANAPLDDIARAAGVGSGTLYRHFPTRMALVEAVYRDSVERLCADGERLAATEPPTEALIDWLRGFVTVVSEKRGLAAALSDEGRAQSLFGECHAMINATGAALLDRAKDSGVIGPHAEPIPGRKRPCHDDGPIDMADRQAGRARRRGSQLRPDDDVAAEEICTPGVLRRRHVGRRDHGDGERSAVRSEAMQPDAIEHEERSVREPPEVRLDIHVIPGDVEQLPWRSAVHRHEVHRSVSQEAIRRRNADAGDDVARRSRRHEVGDLDQVAADRAQARASAPCSKASGRGTLHAREWTGRLRDEAARSGPADRSAIRQ